MSWWDGVRYRLYTRLRRARAAHELDEELGLHAEMDAQFGTRGTGLGNRHRWRHAVAANWETPRWSAARALPSVARSAWRRFPLFSVAHCVTVLLATNIALLLAVLLRPVGASALQVKANGATGMWTVVVIISASAFTVILLSLLLGATMSTLHYDQRDAEYRMRLALGASWQRLVCERGAERFSRLLLACIGGTALSVKGIAAARAYLPESVAETVSGWRSMTLPIPVLVGMALVLLGIEGAGSIADARRLRAATLAPVSAPHVTRAFFFLVAHTSCALLLAALATAFAHGATSVAARVPLTAADSIAGYRLAATTLRILSLTATTVALLAVCVAARLQLRQQLGGLALRRAMGASTTRVLLVAIVPQVKMVGAAVLMAGAIISVASSTVLPLTFGFDTVPVIVNVGAQLLCIVVLIVVAALLAVRKLRITDVSRP